MAIIIGNHHTQIEVKKFDPYTVLLTTLKVTGKPLYINGKPFLIGGKECVDVLETQVLAFTDLVHIDRYIELLTRAKELLQDDSIGENQTYSLQIKGA